MGQRPPITVYIKAFPVVSTLLICSVLGWAVVSLMWPPPQFLTFGGLQQAQYWRVVTPIFMHFGIMHLAFNGLWLVVLGTRIERAFGSLHLLLIVLLSAVLSNFGQVFWSGEVNFGGMSGVIYGLLGYVWIKNYLRPDPLLALPLELIGFMVVWMLLGMSGILTALIGIHVANGAHLFGLLTGMALGLVFGLAAKNNGR